LIDWPGAVYWLNRSLTAPADMIAHALEVFNLRPRKYRNAQLVDSTAETAN
jgi:hypothetical protein